MANCIVIGEIFDRMNDMKGAVISIGANAILITVRALQRLLHKVRGDMQNMVDEDTEEELERFLGEYYREAEDARIRAFERVPDELRVGMDDGGENGM